MYSNFSKFKNFRTFRHKISKSRWRHFQETISFNTHSTANMPTLAILKKSSFFSKPFFVLPKKSKFVRFEITYYFSRILPQICYNLVNKNFQAQKVSKFRNYQLASKRKKTTDLTVLKDDFPSKFQMWAENNNLTLRSENCIIKTFSAYSFEN